MAGTTRGIVADAPRHPARLGRDQHALVGISAAVKGEPGWLPLALLRGLLLATWHDLSDVKLAETLDAPHRRSSLTRPVPRRWRSCRWRSTCTKALLAGYHSILSATAMPPPKPSAHRRWHRPGTLLVALDGNWRRAGRTNHGRRPTAHRRAPRHCCFTNLITRLVNSGRKAASTNAYHVLGKSQERLSVKRRQEGHGILACSQQGMLVRMPCFAGCKRSRQASFCQSRSPHPSDARHDGTTSLVRLT